MLRDNPASMFFLILGMMAATYIPRLLPFYMIRDLRPAPRLKRFLELIPVTALGALILPGVIESIPGNPLAMFLGIGFAAAWAWCKGGITVPVAGAIAIVYVVLQIS